MYNFLLALNSARIFIAYNLIYFTWALIKVYLIKEIYIDLLILFKLYFNIEENVNVFLALG